MKGIAVKSKDNNEASKRTRPTDMSELYEGPKNEERGAIKSLRGAVYPQNARDNKSNDLLYDPNFSSGQLHLNDRNKPGSIRKTAFNERSKFLGGRYHQKTNNIDQYQDLTAQKATEIFYLKARAYNLQQQSKRLKEENQILKAKLAQYESQMLHFKTTIQEKEQENQRLRIRIETFEDNDAQFRSVLAQIDTQIEKIPAESQSQQQSSHQFECLYDKDFNKLKVIKERNQNLIRQLQEQKYFSTKRKENSPLLKDSTQQIEYLRKRCKTLQKISGIILDESKWDFAQETLMDLVQKVLEYWQFYNETI